MFTRLVPSLRAGAVVAAVFAGTMPDAVAAETPIGVFSNKSDVGSVSRPMTAYYDPSSHIYTIGASGTNMWANEDAFGFVWKKVTGDIAIAADIELQGTSDQANRKACLVFRQSLDADSAYADVAVHGGGHTSLQFRSETGGLTSTIRSRVSNPKRVRLEKRGPYVTLSLAGADGVFSSSGCTTRLSFDGPFYVGLAVCAHNNAGFETATFSAVEIGAPPPLAKARSSALEVISLASLFRRVVLAGDGLMQSPHFSPDGNNLYFNTDGRIHRLTLSSDEPPTMVDTGFATECNNDHGISPDGTQLVICDHTETGKSLMYVLPIAGGTPQPVGVREPAYWHGWSPDGKTLTYCAERDGNYDVYTIPVSGGEETRLTDAPSNDNGPDYSADGKWIYFHIVSSNRVQVWRMHTDGSNKEPVLSDEFDNWFPHPSPDGQWILVLSTKVPLETGHPPDGEYVLRLVPTAGGEPREIATFHGGNGSLNVPCWSSDSTQIAFASYAPTP